MFSGHSRTQASSLPTSLTALKNLPSTAASGPQFPPRAQNEQFTNMMLYVPELHL